MTPEEMSEAIGTIATLQIRLEGTVDTLVGAVDKIAVRLEQIVGMIQSVDARIDRLAESFIRHDRRGEAA